MHSGGFTLISRIINDMVFFIIIIAVVGIYYFVFIESVHM